MLGHELVIVLAEVINECLTNLQGEEAVFGWRFLVGCYEMRLGSVADGILEGAKVWQRWSRATTTPQHSAEQWN